jgi:hypothetical protein
MKAIIAASILAIATMSSPAFAYSNVSPKPMHQSRTRHHLSPNAASSFNFAPGLAYERAAPSYEDVPPAFGDPGNPNNLGGLVGGNPNGGP